MGDYPSSDPTLGIVTNKTRGARPGIGDRIWLITGEGRPRRYSLCSWFDISEITDKRLGSFNIQLKGTHGRNLETFVSLGGKKWFPTLKRRCGNFGLGLMPIDDDEIVAELELLI